MPEGIFLETRKFDSPQKSRQMARARKVLVLKRAKYRCEICGYGGSEFFQTLNVHHIVPVSKGGHGGGSNLIALCPNCHAVVHFVGHPRYRYGGTRFKNLSRDTQLYILAGYRYSGYAAEQMLVFLTNEVAMSKHGVMWILESSDTATGGLAT